MFIPGHHHGYQVWNIQSTHTLIWTYFSDRIEEAERLQEASEHEKYDDLTPTSEPIVETVPEASEATIETLPKVPTADAELEGNTSTESNDSEDEGATSNEEELACEVDEHVTASIQTTNASMPGWVNNWSLLANKSDIH